MTTATTTSDLVNLLTKLPAPSSTPPQVASGTVALFRDNNWCSQRLDLATADYVPNKRQTLQSVMFHQVTFCAFNLPVGTVMTMMENVVPVTGDRKVADLSDCGRTIDLVGTGRTEAVDILAMGMNDVLSSFFWRTVDLNMGAIELFEDANFSGIRATIFLSEWNASSLFAIDKWYLQDKLTAIRWKTLQDRQLATLYENVDGSGNQFNNIKGWGNTKDVSNLEDFGFNDYVSAFRWEGINPVKEIIAPFFIVATSGSGSSGLTSVVTGTNDTSVEQPVTLTLTNTDTQSMSVTTTDSSVSSVSETLTLAATVGDPELMSMSATWEVGLKYDYTHTESRNPTQTKTIELCISQTVNAPPKTSYEATLLVKIGQIPPTVYETTAQRWYNVPVNGGVVDPSNRGYYKRTESLNVTMAEVWRAPPP
jgi:hypothetical protein